MTAAYSVKDDVRELVDLRLHNLITEPPPFESGEVDLLLCRNVTIYFNRTTTKALMSRFHTALGDGGYLFLGHSETLWQMSEAFTLVPLGDAFVYRRDDGPQGRVTLPDRRTEAGDAPILLPERRGRTERRRDVPETKSVPPQRVSPQPVSPQPVPQRVSPQRVPPQRVPRQSGPAAAPATGSSAQELVAIAREALAGGRYLDAVAAAGRAAKADPMLVDPHLIGGEALVNLGRDADAIRELRQAVYLQPDSASALLLLAGALDRHGEASRRGPGVPLRRGNRRGLTAGRGVRVLRWSQRRRAGGPLPAARDPSRADREGREIRQVQDTGDTMIGFVTFRLGDRQFACRLDEVREVVRLEGLDVLPGMTPPISGLLELRGNPLPVVDLRAGSYAGARGDVLVTASGYRCGRRDRRSSQRGSRRGRVGLVGRTTVGVAGLRHRRAPPHGREHGTCRAGVARRPAGAVVGHGLSGVSDQT